MPAPKFRVNMTRKELYEFLESHGKKKGTAGWTRDRLMARAKKVAKDVEPAPAAAASGSVARVVPVGAYSTAEKRPGHKTSPRELEWKAANQALENRSEIVRQIAAIVADYDAQIRELQKKREQAVKDFQKATETELEFYERRGALKKRLRKEVGNKYFEDSENDSPSEKDELSDEDFDD